MHAAPSKGGITGHEHAFDMATLAVAARGVNVGVSRRCDTPHWPTGYNRSGCRCPGPRLESATVASMNQKQGNPLGVTVGGLAALVIGAVILSGANRDVNASEWTVGLILVIAGVAAMGGGLWWMVNPRN